MRSARISRAVNGVPPHISPDVIGETPMVATETVALPNSDWCLMCIIWQVALLHPRGGVLYLLISTYIYLYLVILGCVKAADIWDCNGLESLDEGGLIDRLAPGPPGLPPRVFPCSLPATRHWSFFRTSGQCSRRIEKALVRHYRIFKKRGWRIDEGE